jgi:hypothetical protein
MVGQSCLTLRWKSYVCIHHQAFSFFIINYCFMLTFLLSPINLTPPYIKSIYHLANLNFLEILGYNSLMLNYILKYRDNFTFP